MGRISLILPSKKIKMIKINKITPQLVQLFAPDDKFIGWVNEYEFLDVRCQIKKTNTSGYYIIFKNEKFEINPNGSIKNQPNGLFDQTDKYYDYLIFMPD